MKIIKKAKLLGNKKMHNYKYKAVQKTAELETMGL